MYRYTERDIMPTQPLEFVYAHIRTGVVMRTTCPVCYQVIMIPQFGELPGNVSRCQCGVLWKLEITAISADRPQYNIGPSETKS